MRVNQSPVIIKTLKEPLPRGTPVTIGAGWWEDVPVEIQCSRCGGSLRRHLPYGVWSYKHFRSDGCRAPRQIRICILDVLRVVLDEMLARELFQPDESAHDSIEKWVRRVVWQGNQGGPDSLFVELNAAVDVAAA